MGSSNPWSEDHKNILREFWESEAPSQIATRVGKTRNAVIGMAWRLGLKPKARSGGGNQRDKTRPRIRVKEWIPLWQFAPRPLETQQPPAPVPSLPPIAPIPFLDSTYSQCKAVVDGKGPDGLALVCGQPIQEGTRYSWCREHHAKYTYIRRI
jgi:hypothetical protein